MSSTISGLADSSSGVPADRAGPGRRGAGRGGARRRGGRPADDLGNARIARDLCRDRAKQLR